MSKITTVLCLFFTLLFAVITGLFIFTDNSANSDTTTYTGVIEKITYNVDPINSSYCYMESVRVPEEDTVLNVKSCYNRELKEHIGQEVTVYSDGKNYAYSADLLPRPISKQATIFYSAMVVAFICLALKMDSKEV